MRSVRYELHGYQFPFFDHPFNGMLKIGKGEKELTYKSFHACRLFEEFYRQRRFSLIPQFFVHSPHQDFVLAGFVQHISYSFTM
jgi:hypothetical protein